MTRQRRRRIRTALAGAAALLCTACASAANPTDDTSCPPSAGPVTLTYWAWAPHLEDTIARWNRANPDIQVKLVRSPKGAEGTYGRLFNSVRAGSPPDLGQVEFHALPQFRVRRALRDIGNCPGVTEAKPKFVDWTWAQASLGGIGNSVYAIPQDTGPMALLYRADIFERYGITPPRTWEEFERTAATLHAANPKIRLTNFPQDPNWLAAMAWQAGETWFAQDGKRWTVGLDGPGSLRVADFWQRMIDAGTVSSALENALPDTALTSGETAALIQPAWYTTVLAAKAPATKGRWAIAPLPQWDPGRPLGANMGGSTVVVPAGAKHPAEAARFAVWLNTDPEAVALNAANAGLFPATTDGQRNLTEDAKTLAFFGGRPIYPVFRAAAAQVDPSWAWSPTWDLDLKHMQDQLRGLSGPGGSVRQALLNSNAAVINDLRLQANPVATR